MRLSDLLGGLKPVTRVGVPRSVSLAASSASQSFTCSPRVGDHRAVGAGRRRRRWPGRERRRRPVPRRDVPIGTQVPVLLLQLVRARDACGRLLSAAAPVVIRLVRFASVCVCSGSPSGVSSRMACIAPSSSVTSAHEATARQASKPMALWAPMGARSTSAAWGPASAEQTAITSACPLPAPAPTNLTATVNTDGSITLSWTAPADATVTGYQILRRRPQAGETTLLIYVEDTRSTATTYTDTAVTAGTRHTYRVKAINPAGLSAWSNFAAADPP